ncbi:uncharacterized protein LOC108416038 [Pygocentrus nattereri]|uniref:uncharacterized protein LOC108416038 n=1 Tax=Pygocentrus nattereri TaxID=42514 RepID=UPI001890C1F8|nr:uncharacterized protein LOC108416038 [Pygocentrus nattereri]
MRSGWDPGPMYNYANPAYFEVSADTEWGCTLVNNEQILNIEAHKGGSVLLPCYCTDLHTKPEEFSWKKDNPHRKTWEEISSGQYRDRVKLVNGHSPGNLSLLISHLTEEDTGDYRCAVKGSHIIIELTFKACTLVGNSETPLDITAHTGGAVLLPCYCTDQHTTPETFTWQKYNRNRWEDIFSDGDQYRDRVQLVNGHSPGNLSLLISHLTEEDGGGYWCGVKGSHIIIRLTVEEPPQSLPFVPFALVTVIFLHIIVAVVYHTKRNKGCTLVNNEQILNITAHKGGSVLLPCYCTDLHTKPETFSWKKDKPHRKTWEEISSESACTLEKKKKLSITAPIGGSVLLPCYCTDLHATPERFTWQKYNRTRWEVISKDGGSYWCGVKDSYRIILLTVKDGPPNAIASTAVVSVQTSPTTSTTHSSQKPEDGPPNAISSTAVVSVQTSPTTSTTHSSQKPEDGPPNAIASTAVVSVQTSPTTSTTHSSQKPEEGPTKTITSTAVDIQTISSTSTANFSKTPDDYSTSFITIPVVLLLLVLGGVIYWRYRGQRRGQTESREQRRMKRKQKTQDEVTYSTIVHSNTTRTTTVTLIGEKTEYATIRVN